MSADKRKRWDRAMSYLRELNARYASGRHSISGHARKNRTLQYCIERGLVTVKRVAHSGYHYRSNCRTVVDTGLSAGVTPWKERNRIAEEAKAREIQP